MYELCRRNSSDDETIMITMTIDVLISMSRVSLSFPDAVIVRNNEVAIAVHGGMTIALSDYTLLYGTAVVCACMRYIYIYIHTYARVRIIYTFLARARSIARGTRER